MANNWLLQPTKKTKKQGMGYIVLKEKACQEKN